MADDCPPHSAQRRGEEAHGLGGRRAAFMAEHAMLGQEGQFPHRVANARPALVLTSTAARVSVPTVHTQPSCRRRPPAAARSLASLAQGASPG
eukprot:12561882-Alexandrium_andersonii.AAC.1